MAFGERDEHGYNFLPQLNVVRDRQLGGQRVCCWHRPALLCLAAAHSRLVRMRMVVIDRQH